MKKESLLKIITAFMLIIVMVMGGLLSNMTMVAYADVEKDLGNNIISDV